MPTGTNGSVALNTATTQTTTAMWVRTYAGVTGESASVVAEVVNLVDASGNLLDGSGRVQGSAQAPAVITGGGTATGAGGGRVMALVVTNPTAGDLTFTWHGGAADGEIFTVRAGAVLNWTPATEQTATSIVFTTGLDAIVEWA